MSRDSHGKSSSWVDALRVYLVVSATAHVTWEVAQLPFYTIWRNGTWREIAFAVVHCSAGDVMIAALVLLLALLLFGTERWPLERARPVIAATLVFGIAYTIFSEWLNVSVRGSWTYSSLMPVLPIIGTGLMPVLQWMIVPLVAMRVALRPRSS